MRAERGGSAPWWLPAALVVWCVAVRLPGLGLPLLEEGHAYRQSVTAMVARNFHRHGYRLFWPEIDKVPWDLSGVKGPAYTNSEFPLYPWIVALGYGLLGVREWIGRVVSILCTVGAMGVLYVYVKRAAGDWAAAVAAAFFALNPMGIFYTRAFLPEPLMVLLLVVALERLQVWVRTGSRGAWWGVLVAATLAPMVKQPALHVLLPVLAGCLLRHGRSAVRRWDCWLLLLVPLAGTTAWYDWAQWLGRHGQGLFAIGGGSGLINPQLWLHNQDNFYPRFATVMLVLVGAVTGWLAALLSIDKGSGLGLAGWWLLGALAVACVASGAAITHYYYNLPLVAAMAPCVGWGAARWGLAPLRWCVTLLVLLGPLVVLQFPAVPSWYEVNGGEVRAAEAVKRLTPPDALVYTLSRGTQLLYACDRRGEFLITDQGWQQPAEVAAAAQAGFGYFATGRRDLVEGPDGVALMGYLDTRRLVEAGPGYLVYDLQHAAAEP